MFQSKIFRLVLIFFSIIYSGDEYDPIISNYNINTYQNSDLVNGMNTYSSKVNEDINFQNQYITMPNFENSNDFSMDTIYKSFDEDIEIFNINEFSDDFENFLEMKNRIDQSCLNNKDGCCSLQSSNVSKLKESLNFQYNSDSLDFFLNNKIIGLPSFGKYNRDIEDTSSLDAEISKMLSRNKNLAKIQLIKPDELYKSDIYSCVSELIARFAYFRKDIYLFINENLIKNTQTAFKSSNAQNSKDSVLAIGLSLSKLSDHESISEYLMRHIYLSLIFAQELSKFQESSKIYNQMSKKTSKIKKSIDLITSNLKTQELTSESRNKLTKVLELKNLKILQIKSQRKTLHKMPKCELVLNHLKRITNSNLNHSEFNIKWICIFISFFKVKNLSNQYFNEIECYISERLKCPAFYRNRALLYIKESSYLDANSLALVILDWIFYFFSPEFQEHIRNEANSSKLLSRLVVLIVLIFNKKDGLLPILLCENAFTTWVSELEDIFMTQKFTCFTNSIFEKFYNDIIDTTEVLLHTKLFLCSNLEFLSKLKIVIEHYLKDLYKIGFYTFLSKMSEYSE